MDKDQIVEKLNDLLHLDVDAVRAYGEAIERAESQMIGDRLRIYQQDHERHIDEIRLMVTGLGGKPDEPKPDMKGYLIEGMTILRSSMGDQQMLKAMRQNEEITNRAYSDASAWEVPDEIHEVLARGYDDERRHLAYVHEELEVYAQTSHSR